MYAETTLILDPRDVPGRLGYYPPFESRAEHCCAKRPPILIERTTSPDLSREELLYY